MKTGIVFFNKLLDMYLQKLNYFKQCIRKNSSFVENASFEEKTGGNLYVHKMFKSGDNELRGLYYSLFQYNHTYKKLLHFIKNSSIL